MRKTDVRQAILARLVLLTVVVFLLPTLLNANVLSHLKLGKHKQKSKSAELTNKASMSPLLKRRTETIFSHIGSGEPEGAPNSYAKEQVSIRAYPGTDLPIELSNAAANHFSRVKSESQAGQRGQTVDAPWTSIGPSIALYPKILNRTAAPYVASGRISALAIDHHCEEDHCRLYVGAAGGGIWKTNNALATTPTWTFISGSFATNAIGAIAIDPTDRSGRTIYVGTGEPNASGDSGAGQGIYKSTDGGNSWTLLAGSGFALNRSISNVVIDPTNGNTIYVGTTRGVRGVSSTSGATGNPPVGTVAPVGLYKSTDGGNTFSPIFLTLPITPGGFSEGVNQVALDPKDPTTVYAGAFGLGIFRSSPSDAGGAFQQVFYSEDNDGNPAHFDPFDRTAFAVTTKNGHTRMYVGDGNGADIPNGPASQVWRNDNMNQPASALASGNVNGPSWKNLTSSNVADPGYATHNYCTGQCWYDNAIYTPKGQPDTVFVLGSYLYPEQLGSGGSGLSNGRAVLRSTTAGDPDPDHNNRTFTDMIADAGTDPNNNGIHPDQHALVFLPDNPDVWFEGSDGGLMRSNGTYTDVSSKCAARGLTGDNLNACQRLLSAVPTTLTSLNAGLNTLQFQSFSINPKNPQGELLGGTQDNGTFLYEGSSVLWGQTIGGDGGQSGFNVSHPDIRFHTYFAPQIDVNFQGTETTGWDWVSDRFFLPPAEGWSFYIPIIYDPHPGRAGSIFAGLQGVWRTRDNGGPRAYLDQHCNQFTGDFTVLCGDFVELGSPNGLTDPHGRLTSTFWGSDRTGGVVNAIGRAPSDKSTLWAATTTGRVFVSKNADDVSKVPGADGSDVTYTRIDSTSTAAPNRVPTFIYVDARDANHAWISYSGYSARTPATPGHIFEVRFDPDSGTATFTSIDGSLGDMPITSIVRDDPTGDFYASNDFGVLRLPRGSSNWQTAGTGMPMVEVCALAISTKGRVLYAATHGRGGYSLPLPHGGGD
jgi:hypothetical protein